MLDHRNVHHRDNSSIAIGEHLERGKASCLLCADHLGKELADAAKIGRGTHITDRLLQHLCRHIDELVRLHVERLLPLSQRVKLLQNFTLCHILGLECLTNFI